MVSEPFEVPAEMGGDAAEELKGPIADESVNEFGDVSGAAISCRNQQSLPLLHLKILVGYLSV